MLSLRKKKNKSQQKFPFEKRNFNLWLEKHIISNSSKLLQINCPCNFWELNAGQTKRTGEVNQYQI